MEKDRKSLRFLWEKKERRKFASYLNVIFGRMFLAEEKIWRKYKNVNNNNR
jgi:hypothetical protein